MMIERIRREHGYMVQLLSILKGKLAQLNREQEINYGLVKEIVSYLISHSEKVHHPKEDIIYHHYLKKYGEQQAIDNVIDEAVRVLPDAISGDLPKAMNRLHSFKG